MNADANAGSDPHVSRFPVIVGPTAGGKSALAVAVAHRLTRERGVTAEIVSADAYQVYRKMDIGTAKPTEREREGITHHLIDIVEPTERFTLSDWLARAERVIEDCRRRGAVPIVVGGTHLYVKALLEGMFEGPGADEALRETLRAMGREALRAELERVDPEAARRIHPNDERRTIRALEVFRLTGSTISAQQTQWDGAGRARTDALLVGLEWETEAINRRINARVREMMERGLREEVRALATGAEDGTSLLGPTAREALGYKQIVEHLEGTRTLDEAVESIKIETRRFAKNQRTWLRRLRATPGSLWIDAGASAGGVRGEAANAWAQSVLQKMHT